MLNLPIAMFNQLLISLVLLVQSANVLIVSPQPGDVLRGQVEIVGEMNVPNFASAELAFSYASNPADRFTWFTIQTFSQPVQEPILAVWDTTKLTDGDYTLHLRVLLQDGSSQDVVVSDLKIRNDTPLPTVSPTATDPVGFIKINPTATIPPAATALPTLFPSPTPLPVNPVSVTSSSIYSNFARGGLLVLGLFFIFGILLRFRSKA